MGAKKPKPSDYADVLAKIKPRPDAPLLQTVMLRSMKQAVYSPDNQGHFGLAYEAYAHFTSPIRRYPDLLTHRAIKAVLRGETYDPKASWEELGMQCSATERRADEATRDVNAWLKCFYMKDRVGDEFVGTISGVTNFGIFVTLDEVYVEGLVHISELGKDYFHFDQDKHMILGERTRKKYQLADRVNIKVVRVDIETSKIDFALAGDAPKAFVPMEKVETALPKGVVRPTQSTAAPIVLTPKKGKKTPSVELVAVVPKQKTVTTVTSANPPTTPLAGFTSGKEKTAVKVRAPAFKPTLEPAPKSKAEPKTKPKTKQGKTKFSGALLNKKVASKVTSGRPKSKKK
jgi:ribonuclease R